MRVLCKNYHHTVHNMVPIQMDSGKGTELGENNMKSRKDLRRYLRFDPITFSENSNYWRESLLEVIRQDIAG